MYNEKAISGYSKNSRKFKFQINNIQNITACQISTSRILTYWFSDERFLINKKCGLLNLT